MAEGVKMMIKMNDRPNTTPRDALYRSLLAEVDFVLNAIYS